MADPNHRWGIRYSSDSAKNLAYIQTQYTNDNTFAKPGELFLNETLQEIYYVDHATGVAKILGSKDLTLSGTLNIPSAPPTAETDPGTAGDITWDENYVYICVADNTWKRSALAGWV